MSSHDSGSGFTPNSPCNTRLRADLARAERSLQNARSAWARHANQGPQRVEGLTRIDLALFLVRGSSALLSEKSLGALFVARTPETESPPQ